MCLISLLKTSTSGSTHANDNVLAHLRKLPTNASIYDALILYKEMIYS